MKKFDRSPMLPLAASLAAVFMTACANNPAALDLAAPAASTAVTPASADANAGETRDWASIDTNKDHLISPEEMATHLDASRKPATRP